MALHRAAGRAHVRPLHVAGKGTHRESGVPAGVVKACMLGALATATIAVPLASAAAGSEAPVSAALDSGQKTTAAAQDSAAAPTARDTGSTADRSAVRSVPAATDSTGTAYGADADIAEMKVDAPEPEPEKAPATTDAADGSGADAPKAGASGYIKPVDAPITSGFGMRVHPVLGYAKGHDGVDFGAACGTPVHAAAGGTVVAAEFHHASGNRVKVDHGNGVITGYYHLSAFKVSVGDKVSQGQVVGNVGSTGRSTGCHMHFAKMDASGTYSNPMSLLS